MTRIETFPLKTYHSAVLRAMIERDKNHPCVVLWSLGNEPDTEHFPESARDYWRPLYEQAHTQDPQDRPVTMVCCQNDYTKDITTRTMDVVCINRYYGWYNLSGDLDNAAYAFKKELDFWETIDKPLILSEYGADTVAGMHGFAPEMFTEEFQVEYYRTINGCLDERRFVVGSGRGTSRTSRPSRARCAWAAATARACSPVSAPQAGRPLLP